MDQTMAYGTGMEEGRVTGQIRIAVGYGNHGTDSKYENYSAKNTLGHTPDLLPIPKDDRHDQQSQGNSIGEYLAK
jgi:hypothetical protein